VRRPWGWGNFSVDTAVVARYLEAVDRELRSLFLLVLRLTVETETPLAVHLRNPYMPLEIGLAWHPLFNAPYIPATTLKGALRAGARRGACGLPPADLFGYVGQEGALIITDALPASSAAVEPDVITPHYKEPDVREDRAEPTPRLFSGQARRHLRLLCGVPLHRGAMRQGDIRHNQGGLGGGSRGEDQAGVGHSQAIGKFPIPFEEPDSFI
jgi:hypothetical protein